MTEAISRTEDLRILGVLARVSYPGVHFGYRWLQGHSPMVRVECPDGVCNVTGAPMPWNGRWHRLSPHMTDGEIAQTCFLAVILANEHEARESFKVDGVPVFQPHFDLDALVAFAQDRENTKERPHFGEPCKGCGHVGPPPAGFISCCPDGKR